MKIIKIRGHRAQVEPSARGYVGVRVSSLPVNVVVFMEEEDKERLSSDPEGWEDEMSRLEAEAIRLAREGVKIALKESS